MFKSRPRNQDSGAIVITVVPNFFSRPSYVQSDADEKGHATNMPSLWWVLIVSASLALLACAFWIALEHAIH